MRRLYSVLLVAFTTTHLLLLLLLVQHCQPTSSTSHLATSSYEQVLQWSTEYQAHAKTLKSLQKFHNTSAILQFIELTHNFTAEDLTNCRRVSLAALNFSVDAEAYQQFAKEADIATRAAHFLTHLFSSNLHSNVSLHHLITNKEFYWSLLFANLQTNFLIFGAGISFSNIFLNNFIPNLKHFSPYLYRNVRANNDSIKINLSTYKHFAGDSVTETFKSEWFWKLALPEYEATMARWQETTMDSLSGVQGVWTSPYLDCGITKTWLTSYIVPFFKINTVNSNTVSQTTLVGLVLVSINLNQVDINQCPEQNSFFAATHKCHTPSTQCHNVVGSGFRRGSYYCKCRAGFYYQPNNTSLPLMVAGLDNTHSQIIFDGRDVEEAFINTLIGPISDSHFLRNYVCMPCETGCTGDCINKAPCQVKFNYSYRVIVLTIQLLCIFTCSIFGLLVFKLRYKKKVASSRWVMLETILFGAILIYITVILRYYESSTTTCFLEPWFREIGFAFFYGSVIIKVYRIYAEFQTRKAHRVCVRDKDLLKYLLGIVLIVFGYMSAWTALVIDGIDNMRNISFFGLVFNFTSKNILDEKYEQSGLKYYVCRQMAWDYVTEIGELLFLLSGVYLTYRIRKAQKEVYEEKVTLSIAIILETVASFLMYIIKHSVWSHPELHPDHILTLYFIRCQVTISITICILYFPKIFQRTPKRTAHHRSRHLSSAEVSDTLPDAINIHSAILSNGEIDIGEINLTDMDPEDIRSELRRVYTQLQILKNKSIRKDNPHISKRRGGRKSHRRFSLQHFHHKHKAHDQEVTEISRTPEESTASIDGGTSCMPDGPSMVGKNDVEVGNSSTSTKSYTHKHS